jgi:hypothetical protein
MVFCTVSQFSLGWKPFKPCLTWWCPWRVSGHDYVRLCARSRTPAVHCSQGKGPSPSALGLQVMLATLTGVDYKVVLFPVLHLTRWRIRCQWVVSCHAGWSRSRVLRTCVRRACSGGGRPKGVVFVVRKTTRGWFFVEKIETSLIFVTYCTRGNRIFVSHIMH